MIIIFQLYVARTRKIKIKRLLVRLHNTNALELAPSEANILPTWSLAVFFLSSRALRQPLQTPVNGNHHCTFDSILRSVHLAVKLFFRTASAEAQSNTCQLYKILKRQCLTSAFQAVMYQCSHVNAKNCISGGSRIYQLGRPDSDQMNI
jgi:lysylphosphatidylglycerol synthetase-like protein (DUF2156 family)